MQQLKKLYAKSIDEKGHKTTLIQHLREVTTQMCEFVTLYKKQLESIDNSLNIPRLLIYSAFLHDFGKVHSGFQKQLFEEKIWGYRHEVLSLAFVRYLDVPENELSYLLAGIGLHHKDLFDIEQKYYNSDFLSYNKSNSIENLEVLSRGVSQEIIDELEDFIKGEYLFKFIKNYNLKFERYKFNESFKLTPDKIPSEIFNNIKIIIENNKSFVKKGGRGSKDTINYTNIQKGMISRGFVLSADHLASAYQGCLKLSQGVNNLDDLIKLFPFLDNLRPHQDKISKKFGNTILIAPTGSGKTESSLLWSVYQKQINNSKGRTFILLPYRASMNAMGKRLGEKFGEKEISLVHGKSLVKAYTDLMEQKYTRKEAWKTAREKETLARMNTSPIRISSPYAIFKPFFGYKGYEANLVSMLGSTIIFDEIHAYDTKITGFTLASAKYISKMFNSSLLFMSATMPTHLQEILIENFDTGELIKPDKEFLEKNIRHKLKVRENSIFDCIDEIIFEAKENNKSVLVVVNTVDKAIEIYNKISEKYKKIVLLHSRFTANDRNKKEELIKPEQGKILVSTQVVEVSLDIDYYTCYTEIAPFESLLQRFGRVNRHAIREPAIVNVCCSNKNDDKVYNIDYLCQTYNTLLEFDNQIISELKVQELLDKSYPEKLKNDLKEEVNNNIKDFTESFINTLTPYGVENKQIMKDLMKKWSDLFDGYEIIPKSIFEKTNKKRLNSLEISNFMIPISRGKYHALCKKNLIEKNDDFIHIYNDTNNPYNSDTGLVF